MLDGSIFRQPGQNKLSLFDVGLSGEIGEVLVVLPEPDLGLLEASHALVTPTHCHGYRKLKQAERFD